MLTRVYDVEVLRIDEIGVKGADRLGSLYESQYAAATRLAYTLTGDVHAAQDIAHDAFIRVGRKLFGLHDADHARAYLFRTVVNLSRGRARRQRTERAALQKLESQPQHGPSEVTDQDETWKALLKLPIRQRAALFLRYYQDFSEAQAAEALGCSVGAIKSLVNRGLKELRARDEGGSDD